MSRAHDLTGKTYGLLTVVGRDLTDLRKDPRWICRCQCGTVKSLFGIQLKAGKTTSCGCKLAEQARLRATTHGKTRTPEHRSWVSMNSRCNNKNHHAYPEYGGRGVRVCEKWKSFETFLADMGPRPTPDHTLDRMNNDGNYEPENCRWATKLEQRLNRREPGRIVEIDGIRRRLMEWSRICGIPFDVIHKRLGAGWDPKRAITQPRRITAASYRSKS